jgi:hypothetical protein
MTSAMKRKGLYEATLGRRNHPWSRDALAILMLLTVKLERRGWGSWTVDDLADRTADALRPAHLRRLWRVPFTVAALRLRQNQRGGLADAASVVDRRFRQLLPVIPAAFVVERFFLVAGG